MPWPSGCWAPREVTDLKRPESVHIRAIFRSMLPLSFFYRLTLNTSWLFFFVCSYTVFFLVPLFHAVPVLVNVYNRGRRKVSHFARFSLRCFTEILKVLPGRHFNVERQAKVCDAKQWLLRRISQVCELWHFFIFKYIQLFQNGGFMSGIAWRNARLSNYVSNYASLKGAQQMPTRHSVLFRSCWVDMSSWWCWG